MRADTQTAGRPRWRGQRGRLEVWYATLTAGDGTGLWLHQEVVAPVEGEPYAHGWAAVFPPATAPVLERFGPVPAVPVEPGRWFAAGGVTVDPERLTGRAGDVSWDLAWRDDGPPLWTFPRWVWRRQALPSAQVVPAPCARFDGRLSYAGADHELVAVRGGLAHINGHGNAQRWGWLHADLGDGAVLEIVTAVARRPGLNRLPPLALVQLRRPGRPDWPRDPLAAAPLFRTRLGLPEWGVRGTVGTRRLTVRVRQPDDRCVALGYTDPDGATATCTNSERADVEVRLERRRRGGWDEERSWRLDGTGHAEVGTRP